MRELHSRGVTDITAVFIGDGPELPAVKAEARGLDNVIFTGAIPHEQMPTDAGVAAVYRY